MACSESASLLLHAGVPVRRSAVRVVELYKLSALAVRVGGAHQDKRYAESLPSVNASVGTATTAEAKDLYCLTRRPERMGNTIMIPA